MGGRGASSGSGGSNNANYKNSFETEISNALDFAASFAIDKSATKSDIGYQMYVHKSVTGRSLIADTQNDINSLKSEIKQANDIGKSYGMDQQSINGMKAGMKYKVKLMESAITSMTNARGEYEKFQKASRIGIAKAQKRNGRWM